LARADRTFDRKFRTNRAAEQKWYAVTGRVVEVRAEADGDLHIALQDATDDKPGIVVAEIPAKPHKRWCELRKIVFSWPHAKFPFHVRSGRKLKIAGSRIATVTGKAFFDINHAPADQSNRRTDLQGYAAWEIHPLMKIAVNGSSLLCRIGPVAFFMKPFDDEKFIAAVRDALNQSLIRK